MKTYELKGTKRADLGKKASKQIRRNGGIPCNLYGGKDNVSFCVNFSDIRRLIYTADIYVVALDIDGEKHDAVLRELQFHPVSDALLHVDFLEVDEKKPIVMEVPTRLEGLAEGVKAGGKLIQQMRYLKARGMYDKIPEFFTIDVTNLGINKAIKVKDLKFDNVELISAANNVVASIKATRQAAAAAAAAAASAKEEASNAAE